VEKGRGRRGWANGPLLEQGGGWGGGLKKAFGKGSLSAEAWGVGVPPNRAQRY